PDWGTRVFNFGRREVANFLLGNALFWLERYHVDGLRVDAVASMIYRDYSRKAGEWIPNVFGGRENLEAIAFLKRLNEVVYGTHCLARKMPGDDWQRFANLRLLYGFMWAYPGKKLLFMGGEFGQSDEWNHDKSLDWHLLDQGPYHRGVQRLVADLNRQYRGRPSLHQLDCETAGFAWMDCSDADQSIVAFARFGRAPGDLTVCVCNFTPVPRHGYRVGVPRGGFYREILNTDSAYYGGSDLGNGGGVVGEAIPWHGQSHSVLLALPPLAAVWLASGEA